jgi:hypothetical protein
VIAMPVANDLLENPLSVTLFFFVPKFLLEGWSFGLGRMVRDRGAPHFAHCLEGWLCSPPFKLLQVPPSKGGQCMYMPCKLSIRPPPDA